MLKPKIYPLILFFSLILLLGFGFGKSAIAAYESSGNFISTNLLDGVNVKTIDSFVYNLSAKPANTGATIQFSENNSTWFNSSGTQDGSNTLTTGSNNSISLSTLGWTTANFYYKVSFTTSDGVGTPVLDDITLHYTTYTPYASAPCSMNNTDGTCTVADAGDYASLPVCKVCNGTDLTTVNATNNTQDTVGNTCNGTCAACQSGSCGNATVDTDPGSQCGAENCEDTNCVGTSAACKILSSGEGACSLCSECNDADVACDLIADGTPDTTGSATTTICYACDGGGDQTAETVDGASATALGCSAGVSEGCRKCISGSCGYYTSAQHACSDGEVCDDTGTCASGGPTSCAESCPLYCGESFVNCSIPRGGCGLMSAISACGAPSEHQHFECGVDEVCCCSWTP